MVNSSLPAVNYAIQDVNCTMNNYDLRECPYRPADSSVCLAGDPSFIAGAICTEGGERKYYIETRNIIVLLCWFAFLKCQVSAQMESLDLETSSTLTMAIKQSEDKWKSATMELTFQFAVVD